MSDFTIEFPVAQCPIHKCGKAHKYRIEVRTIMLFGGRSSSGRAVQEHELVVECPSTGESYAVTVEIPRPQGQKIARVKVRSEE